MLGGDQGLQYLDNTTWLAFSYVSSSVCLSEGNFRSEGFKHDNRDLVLFDIQAKAAGKNQRCFPLATYEPSHSTGQMTLLWTSYSGVPYLDKLLSICPFLVCDPTQVRP